MRSHFLILLGLLLSLSACAPVMLGRTPTPAAPGVMETSISLGYPVSLTEPPECAFVCHYIGPDYWSLPLPATIHVAYGRSATLATNFGLMFIPSFGARYGAKERFLEEPAELAFDYGVSLYLTNIGFDAGILAAVPLGGMKLYGALRGFGNLYFVGPGGAAAVTLGGEVPIEEGSRVLIELSFLATTYNGVPADSPAQPLGFALVPSLSFKF